MSKPVISETQRRYAICIGINHYDASACMPDLRFAENDACALHELLLQHGFLPQHCRLLTGAQATLDAIQQALRDIVLTRPGKDDLVVFYFAGHGTLVSLPDEEEQDEPQTDVFLVSHDFSYQHIARESGLWLEHPLRLENLRTRFFERTRSKKVLFLFDSCHSGDFPGSPYREGESPAAHIKQMFAKSSAGRVALSSCMPQQKARENAQFKHGLFTHYLLEALAGRAPEAVGHDGWVTVGSLFDYLSRRLPEHQRPVRSGVEHGSFQLLYYEQYARTNPPSTSQANEDEQRRISRQQRLQALLADHHGFMDDRLSSFVGRERELAEVRQRIAEKQATGGYVTITGQAGQGKSSVIAKLVDEYGPENVAFHFIPLNPGPDHQVGLLRNLMARLILKHNLSDLYVASENRAVLRDYFPKVLAEIAEKGVQEVVFIDGLDQLEEEFSGVRDLSFLPTDPPTGVVFVLGTRPNDTLRPLTLLKPQSEYVLPNLSRNDFDLILRYRKVNLDASLTDRFYQVMQENALYLDLVARELAEEGVMPPTEIIKRIANDPSSIFSLAMSRLKLHHTQWREIIKPVLGVLLAAREPLLIRHIRQILEVEDDWLREGIERLGGLIAKDGQQRCSLFHLKLQDYLRQDESNPDNAYIFAADEEEGWHKKLAQWCERGNLSIIWQDQGNPLEQGRREYARRHYITHLYLAKEWQHLFTVLDTEVYGKEKVQVDPSTRLFAQDLDLGRYAAARSEESLEKGLELLPHLWRYTLLGCSLTSRADKYPKEAFMALMLLRREAEAIGLAELLTKQDFKVEVLLSIARLFKLQDKREQEYLQILLRAYEVVRMLTEGEKYTNILSELSMELTEAHLWEKAEKLVYTIKDSEIQAEVLSRLCIELISVQQLKRAEEVARMIKVSNTRAQMLSNLSREFARAQQWVRAKEVAYAIDSQELQIRILSELNTELIKAQQWEQAEELAISIQDREVQIRIMQELVVALTQARQWKQAEKVVKTIKDREVLNRVKGELCIELAKAQQWKQAEELADGIQDREVLDRVKGELCIELAKAQQWERAEAVAYAIETGSERIRVLSVLSSELLKMQQWKRAEEVACTISESGERIKVLGKLFVLLIEAQQAEQADKLWIQITKEVRTIEEWKRTSILSELIVKLSKAHQWERAEELTRIDKENDVRAELLYMLATMLAKAQQWERAEKIWARAEKIDWFDVDRRIRDQALYARSIALAKAQQWKRAEMIWAKAEEMVWSTYNFEEFISLLCALVTALAKAEQWNRAKKILENAEQALDEWGHDTRSWRLIDLGEALIEFLQGERSEKEASLILPLEKYAKALIESGNVLNQTLRWEQAVEQALEEAETIVDSTKRDEIFVELGIELAEAQQWKRVEEVISSMWDKKRSEKVLSVFSIELAKAQQWKQAREVAYNIQDGQERARVLYILAALLAQAQQWNLAENVWSEATEMEWADIESVQTLSEIGTALAQSQQWKQAEEVWMQVNEAIHRLRRGEESFQALIRFGTALAKAQLWERTEEVWTRVKEVIHDLQISDVFEEEISIEFDEEVAEQNIADQFFRDQLLIELCSVLYQYQRWDLAEEVSRMIVDLVTRAEMMGNISNELARAGLRSKSEKLWAELIKEARVIQDDWVRIDVLQRLGIALARAQFWTWAQSIASMIKEPWARAKILIQLGRCYTQEGRAEEAKEAWHRAEEEAHLVHDSGIRTEVLRELALSLIQAQQLEHAKIVAHRISEPGDRVDVLIQLGNHFAHLSLMESAKKVWGEARTTTFSIQEHRVRSDMLQRLGTALAQVQQWEQAEKLWIEAEEEAYLTKDDLSRDEALGEISKSLALMQRWERSEEIAKKIRGNVHRARIMLELGIQLAKAQEGERACFILANAESTAHTIENVESKTMTLKKIAEILNMMRSHVQLLHLVQYSWLQAHTREQAIALLPLANELIPLRPEIGVAFCESFRWADTILRG